jgi:hypothetical protein
VIAYRATVDVSRELAQFVAGLLLAERRRRGTPRGSRALTCFWEAVLGLRWFRDRSSPDALARDHGISRATAYRYLDEVIAVLAEQAPDLHQALERAKDEGFSHVILDGKIIPCDRCKEPAVSVQGQVIDLWYSGKAHTHGGNIQAVLAPGGFPLWVSPAEPGSVHDITAARIHALPALYRAAAQKLPTLADPGYEAIAENGQRRAAQPQVGVRPARCVRSRLVVAGGEGVQQFLQGAAGVGEALRPDDLRPVLLDLGDPVAGVVERTAAAGGRKNELGPLVGAVGPAFQIAQRLQVADQLGDGGQAQLSPARQVGEPDAVHADVAEDVQVRLPQVGVAVPGRGLE